MKSGKRLEDNFKKSIPKDVYYYRFKDGTSAWDGGTKTRFQATNISDCFLYNNKQLFVFELKSHKGKSIPFTCIRDNQEKEMLDATKHGIKCGLIVELSDISRVFYLDIVKYHNYKRLTDVKSIPLKYLEDDGIEIEVIKKRVNVKLNIKGLLETIHKKES